MACEVDPTALQRGPKRGHLKVLRSRIGTTSKPFLSSISSVIGKGASPDFVPLLGRPEFMRRPPMLLFPGTVMLLPTADGGCDVNACLNEEEFAALGAEPECNEFAESVGSSRTRLDYIL